jgi:hypothetical protein
MEGSSESVPDFAPRSTPNLCRIFSPRFIKEKKIADEVGVTWFSKSGTYCKMTEAGDGAGPKPDKV